jgi:lysozyme
MSLINLLIKHEGMKLKSYKCPAGKLTIGVGRNVEDLGITEEEALYLLRNDINRVNEELRDNFPWFKDLDPVRQDVLINLCFNIGLTKLFGFKKMLAALRDGNYEEAAIQMEDSAWRVQTGRRAHELIEMMKTGFYLKGE